MKKSIYQPFPKSHIIFQIEEGEGIDKNLGFQDLMIGDSPVNDMGGQTSEVAYWWDGETAIIRGNMIFPYGSTGGNYLCVCKPNGLNYTFMNEEETEEAKNFYIKILKRVKSFCK